jgi:hypothetical protein
VYGQTAPVITSSNGQQTTNYAAFWYLGGITPGCCNDTPNGFYTQWPVYLTTNTQDPNPSIQWSTDSPSLLQIVPNGTSGATLISLGHSSPVSKTFDINVFVTVDGLTSSPFPVYINTPWTQSASAPNPSACNYVGATNGYLAAFIQTITDLTGTQLIPIDMRETFENYVPKPPDDWGLPPEATWAVADWSPPPNSTFTDTAVLCWGGNPAPMPPTAPWNPNGGTQFDSFTQKFWAGSPNQRFQGECTVRQAINEYTNHISFSNVTTPVSNQGDCAQGQFANN